MSLFEKKNNYLQSQNISSFRFSEIRTCDNNVNDVWKWWRYARVIINVDGVMEVVEIRTCDNKC